MLTEAFVEYLHSRHDGSKIATLEAALRSHGYEREAWALQSFSEQHSEIFSVRENPWHNTRCHIGTVPPGSANPGEIWFDVVEMTPSILVPNPEDWSDDVMGWQALHPVFVWQYLSFLKSMKFELADTEAVYLDIERTGRKRDFFESARIYDQDESNYVTNIYRDEAKAYVRWFGKALLGENISHAREFLDDLMLRQVVPKGLNLWDNMVLPDETLAVAFNLTTIDYEVEDELQSLDVPENSKAVYQIFEASPHTGVSSIVYWKGGLFDGRPPILVHPYFELQNQAPR